MRMRFHLVIKKREDNLISHYQVIRYAQSLDIHKQI